MLIFQFKYEKLTDEESNIVKGFGNFLNNVVLNEISTPINQLKVRLRIPYLYKVSWIHWVKKNITTQQIFDSIYKSFKFVRHKDNICILEINTSILIPNTRNQYK